MKRKIALLLAGVMALTALPMQIFGATDSSFEGAVQNITASEDTMVVEMGITSSMFDEDNANEYDSVAYAGSYLVIEWKNNIPSGTAINVDLTNASWAFGVEDSRGLPSYLTSLDVVAGEAYGSYDSTARVYTRNVGTGNFEVPYTLNVSRGDSSKGTLVVREDWFKANESDVIRVPIVAKANGNGNATVTVSGTQATTASYTFAVVGTADTVTTAKSADKKGTDLLEDVIIRVAESRAGTIRPGTFTIEVNDGEFYRFPSSTSTILVEGTGGFVNWTFPDATLDKDGILHVTVPSGVNSVDAPGTIVISGLAVEFDLEAGDDVTADIDGGDNTKITDETFTIGVAVTEGVTITTDSAKIPELVTGRFDSKEAKPDANKAARVTFAETVQDSWSARKETILEVPDGVSIRAIKVTKADGIVGGDSLVNKTIFVDTEYGTPISMTVGTGTIEVNAGDITMKRLTTDDTVELTFDIWVSIDADYEGDVTLTASGGGGIDSDCVIATTVQPFSAVVKDGKLIITENFAGAFPKDSTLYITVGNPPGSMYYNTDYLPMPKNADAAEIGGTQLDLDVDVISNNNKSLRSSGGALYGDMLVIENAKKSKEAATIEVINLPGIANMEYSIYISGDAIAENYEGLFDNDSLEDSTSCPGIEIVINEGANPYIGNQTATGFFGFAHGVKLGGSVVFTIGSAAVKSADGTYTAEQAAYINPATNSTMLPLRAMMYALGLTADDVTWDGVNKKVYVTLPDGTVLEFQVGSYVSKMTLSSGGVQVYEMRNDEGTPVPLENIDGTTFLPVRAIGDILGLSTAWNGASRTVTYTQE